MGKISTRSVLKQILPHFVRLFLMLNLIAADLGYSETLSFLYTKVDFKSYYFVSWFSNSVLVLSFPLVFFKYCKCNENKNRNKGENEKKKDSKGLPWQKMITFSLIFSPFQLFSSYLWFISMDKIPVSLNLSIYTSSNVVVFIGSLLLMWKNTRRHLLLKLFAFIACITGVVLLSTLGGYGDTSHRFSPSDYVSGIVITIISASLLGIFCVFYERLFSDLKTYEAILLQCFNGFIVLILYWVFVPFVHFMDFEPVIDHADPFVYVFVFAIGALESYFYISNIVLVAASNSLYAAICLSSSIGISVLIDFLIFNVTYNAMAYTSIGIIFLSAIGINVAEVLPEKWDPLYWLFFRGSSKKRGMLINAHSTDNIWPYPSIEEV